MATTETTFFDSTTIGGRVQIALDLDGVTTDDTIDISGLGDAAGSGSDQPRVQIERIRWCQTSGGIITLEWDKAGASDELIMKLYGNGHWSVSYTHLTLPTTPYV